MKILVIAHYQGDGSPCAIFVHDQVKAYIKQGCEVRVIVPIAMMRKDYYGMRFSTDIIHRNIIDGVQYIFIRYISLSNFGDKFFDFNTKSVIKTIKKKFDNIIQNYEPDIIHAHTFSIDSNIGIFIKQKLNIPLVITTHGSDLEQRLQNDRENEVKSALLKTDAVVAVSSKLERKIRSLNCNIKSDVILNGCEIENKLVRKKKKHSLIYVGNLIKQKNVDVVIKGVSKLKETYPDVQMTIIGSGGERSALELLCDELGVAENITFLGQLPNKQVLEMMAQNEYFVMPSVNEGFGIVYIEAMSSGCVTIGTEGEGISDVIHSGENGFLINPDPDDIVEVIMKCENDKELKKEISRNGINDACGLTWDFNAKNYITLFEQLIE